MRIVITMVGLLMLACVSMVTAADQLTTTNLEAVGQSSNQIYAVYLPGGVSYVFQQMEMVDFKGMKCWKGKHINMTWVRNKTIYIPVDKIFSIIEFDSIQEYKEMLQKFNEERTK